MYGTLPISCLREAMSLPGIKLRRGWPGVGSQIDFRKSKVVHLSKCPNTLFFGVLRCFWRKIFLRRRRRRKNFQNRQFFARKWVTFQNFRRFRHRKVGHLSILVTPPPFGSVTPSCLIPGPYIRHKQWLNTVIVWWHSRYELQCLQRYRWHGAV